MRGGGLAVGGVVPGARALVLAAAAATRMAHPDDSRGGAARRRRGRSGGGARTAGARLSAWGWFRQRWPAPTSAPNHRWRRGCDWSTSCCVSRARTSISWWCRRGRSGHRFPLPARAGGVRVRSAGRRPDRSPRPRARLTAAGYRRVDLVEEAGEFAIRGWVIDLHMGGEHGVRIATRRRRGGVDPVLRSGQPARNG